VILTQPDISVIAKLIGDPARARMLMALMGGKALTASELANEADITAQTASSHLAKMVVSSLLLVRKQGRHKYFQLKSIAIAELLETLLNVSAVSSSICTGPQDPRLRKARVCYDHLAGEYAVALFQALLRSGYLQESEFTVLTNKGAEFFCRLGYDIPRLTKLPRPVCKSCLDWSERRFHLAGGLGKSILDDLLINKWASRDLDSRVISFSNNGLRRFSQTYNLIL